MYNKKAVIKRNNRLIMIFLVVTVFIASYFFVTLSEELYPQYEIVRDPRKLSLTNSLPKWIKVVQEGGERKLVDEKNAFKIKISDDWSIFSADASSISIGLFNTDKQTTRQGFKVGVYKDDKSTNLAIWVRDWVVKSDCPFCYSTPNKLEDNLYNVVNKDSQDQSASYFFRKNDQVYEISIFDKSLDIKQILNYFEFASSSATTTTPQN